MNFTPFVGQLAGSIPAAAMHHFTTSPKVTQSFAAATANGAQMGQVVGVLSGGEGGVHYLRPVEGGAGFQALPHSPAQQQFITLPITVPGAKPGDPQQTLQIQVMNPNVISSLSSQIHQPKYQMTQIPIQGFQQSELGTVLTVAYAQQEGGEGVQIIGNAALPEGLQVVAALQPQDIQMITGHMQDQEQMLSGGKSPDNAQAQTIQISQLLRSQQILSAEDVKKSSNNNNNNTFRIKQENTNGDENIKLEDVEVVQQGGQQWTIASPNADLNEYLRQLPGGAQLQQFLRFNNESSITKSNESDEESVEKATSKDKETQESMQQTDDADIEVPARIKKKKKYKKKPPKPKKPKPGQVVIATSLDGTTLFCCPECHMAYPDKEMLEHHLVGHKIERRYICGICGAGLKRREHLERHKLGHNPDRPFVCSVCLKGFKRKEHLNLHFVIHSGEKTEICPECGKGFYRKDHLRKHTRAHASKRAREEMLTITLHQQNQSGGTSNETNNVQQTSSNITMSSIHPEITIHVPTSTSSVPIQITLPQHLVSMANNTNTTVTETINIKQELDGMLMQ